MKSILQNKLTNRLMLLFVLTGTLIYLRTPPKARAGTGCCTICDVGNGICVAHCRDLYTGTALQQCIAQCDATLKQCVKGCPGGCQGPPPSR
jgi:hypothetical protein